MKLITIRDSHWLARALTALGIGRDPMLGPLGFIIGIERKRRESDHAMRQRLKGSIDAIRNPDRGAPWWASSEEEAEVDEFGKTVCGKDLN